MEKGLEVQQEKLLVYKSEAILEVKMEETVPQSTAVLLEMERRERSRRV